MKSVKDWKVQQELDPKVRWVPRWNQEPAQASRFLCEPAVLRVHGSKMFTLVCQHEFSTEDRWGDPTIECRLCKEGKPPREVGMAVVEKDGEGLPRLMNAGMEKFWAPFLREHEDVYLMQAFQISYDKGSRKYGWKALPASGGSDTFVGPDYLEDIARMLASDEWFDRYSIKSPWGEGERETRHAVLFPKFEEQDDEKIESYILIDDPEV